MSTVLQLDKHRPLAAFDWCTLKMILVPVVPSNEKLAKFCGRMQVWRLPVVHAQHTVCVLQIHTS